MTAAESSVARTHISLNVSDVERSVAFYETLFGVPAHKRRPGYANFDVPSPALKLALNEHAPSEATTPRLSHLGVQVPTPEDVETARKRLETIITFDEGDTVCCYARQDKVWVTDPDGNSWEIYYLLDEMDDHDDHEFEAAGQDVPAEACCSDITPRIAAKSLSMAGGSCGCATTAAGCCSP